MNQLVAKLQALLTWTECSTLAADLVSTPNGCPGDEIVPISGVTSGVGAANAGRGKTEANMLSMPVAAWLETLGTVRTSDLLTALLFLATREGRV